MIAGACLLASANPNRASPHHCGHARLRRQAKATQEILKGALRAQWIEGIDAVLEINKRVRPDTVA